MQLDVHAFGRDACAVVAPGPLDERPVPVADSVIEPWHFCRGPPRDALGSGIVRVAELLTVDESASHRLCQGNEMHDANLHRLRRNGVVLQKKGSIVTPRHIGVWVEIGTGHQEVSGLQTGAQQPTAFECPVHEYEAKRVNGRRL